MSEKIAIVTGGSRGIGAEAAKLAGAQGYTVIVNFVSNQSAADKVVGEDRKSVV